MKIVDNGRTYRGAERELWTDILLEANDLCLREEDALRMCDNHQGINYYPKQLED